MAKKSMYVFHELRGINVYEVLQGGTRISTGLNYPPTKMVNSLGRENLLKKGANGVVSKV
jgi:hypothetical protein